MQRDHHSPFCFWAHIHICSLYPLTRNLAFSRINSDLFPMRSVVRTNSTQSHLRHSSSHPQPLTQHSTPKILPKFIMKIFNPQQNLMAVSVKKLPYSSCEGIKIRHTQYNNWPAWLISNLHSLTKVQVDRIMSRSVISIPHFCLQIAITIFIRKCHTI